MGLVGGLRAGSGLVGVVWPVQAVWAGGLRVFQAGVHGLRTSLSPPGLPGDLPTLPCLVCCSSLAPARSCKRCRSFCTAVLHGASFVPLGRPGGPGTP